MTSSPLSLSPRRGEGRGEGHSCATDACNLWLRTREAFAASAGNLQQKFVLLDVQEDHDEKAEAEPVAQLDAFFDRVALLPDARARERGEMAPVRDAYRHARSPRGGG